MKIALVYDRVNKWGGAERVLLALHELFPEAPLYTSVYNSEKAQWAKVFDIKTSFLQNFPHAPSSHESYAVLMPLAFESFVFDEYDLVISVTSEAAKGIITKPKTLHICYCLTPTRYLWSGYDDYFKNPLFKFIANPIVSSLRKWDRIAAQRPDFYVAISNEVKKRIKDYYNRDCDVIYPPVTLLESNTENINGFVENTGYFLVVSRLVSYKKIDLAIKAFNKLGIKLKVIGIGAQKRRLEKLAGPNVEFLGNLTDEQLIKYYRNCIGLVFPAHEDFGLTALEAQSFGKPVIAYKGGGALETVIPGRTGELFSPQTVEALLEKLKAFQNINYNPVNCIRQAEKFNKDRFKKEFEEFVKSKINKYFN